MTTDEFIKQVEELGYTVECDNSVLFVRIINLGTVACVLSLETGRQYSLHMRPANFSYFIDCEEEREELYNLAVEYDKTPVEKREKEKRYRIRWDLSNLEERTSYLNRNEEGDIFFSNDRSTAKVQTVFTALEVELMPLWVSHFIVEKFLVQEEVKDDF